MKKKFTLKMQGKTIVDMEVDGDDDLVQNFADKVLLGGFGAFYKLRDELGEFFVNGIKSSYKLVAKDEKGRFVNPITNPPDKQK